MNQNQWWNDYATMTQIYARFQAANLDRRAFLRFATAVGGTGALAVALAACGDDDDDDEPAQPSSPSPEPDDDEEEDEEPTEEPDEDDEEEEPTEEPDDEPGEPRDLVLAQGADPETLDPHATTTRSTWNVHCQIYETLTRVAFTDDDEAFLEPLLAESWEIVDDTTWEFHLHDGITFTNGEACDAEAVKYSIERMMNNEGLVARAYVVGVAEVEAVDDVTVRVLTDGPYPLLALDFSNVFIVPPAHTEDVGDTDFARQPIGTGPFMLAEWVADDHITLDANADYWQGAPQLTSVRIVPIPESSTRSAALVAGDIDVATIIAISDIGLVDQSGDANVVSAPSQRCVFIDLCQGVEGGIDDVRVRQAMNYAVNKEAIVERIFGGFGTVLQGQPVSPQFFGFNPNIEAYPYDPDRARELLAEAGFEDGFETTMWSSRGRYVLDFETAQAVAGQLQEVGITVDVQPLEWAVYIERLAAADLAPMHYKAWATYNDAAPMLRTFATEQLYSHASVEGLDEIWEQSRRVVDPDERLALLHESLQIVHDEALAIFLHQLPNIYGVRDNVQGFRLYSNEAFFLYDVTMS